MKGENDCRKTINNGGKNLIGFFLGDSFFPLPFVIAMVLFKYILRKYKGCGENYKNIRKD